MALVAGGGIDKPLPPALLSQLLPPVRGLRIAAPYSSHDDERAPLIPTGTPASSTSASSDPAPTTSFPGATAAKQWSSFTRVGDVFDTWAKQGHEEPYANIDIEMAFPPPVRGLRIAAPYSSHDDERAPLIPTGTPASSTSASSDPAPTTSFPGATAAKQWSPFTRVGDVFDTWTKQGHEEPNADIDIEMAFPAASFPKPASSMLKDNSALPRWAKRRVGDGEALRFQGSSKDSGAGSSQPAASSSVASAPGQSAAESMVGAGTLSGSVMGAGSGFGSVVGTGSASGQVLPESLFRNYFGNMIPYDHQFF